MKLLAQKFPGSILVFATMREGTELSKGEINRIRELAEWGRKYDERRQTRAHSDSAYRTELFAADPLSFHGKKKGESIKP